MKRFISVLIVFSMLLSALALAACEDKEGAERESDTEGKVISAATDITPSETETEEAGDVPDIDVKNYGDTVYLTVQSDNRMDTIWAEESSADAMSQALYDRQMKVKDHIGVDIYAKDAGRPAEYAAPFMTAVKSKDGSVDVLLACSYVGITSIIQGGYIQDLNNIPELDLEADYWNVDYMDSIAIEGKRYLGYSDMNMAKTHVITFNKDIMEQYSDALDESVYDSVRNYHWTIDEMISLANLVYVDSTSDGKTVDDTFGLVGKQWIPFIIFGSSCNIKYVDMNEQGEYAVSVYNDVNKSKMATLIDKLSTLAASDSAWLWDNSNTTPETYLYDGRALMELRHTHNVIEYLNHDVNFGMLPYPMFDEAQKDVGYLSLNWDGYICMPSYIRNQTMAAETVELLSHYSDNVRLTYYEKLLGKQVADAPDDKQMLDIIWDSIVSDFGLTYMSIDVSLNNIFYMIPMLTLPHSTYELASFVQTNERTANKKISKFIKEVQSAAN
ncbi:MAG: hypothetical protein IJY39_01765 [Clostridia bacterium]|nr:hypothetical protein [Clostridia bacterium]